MEFLGHTVTLNFEDLSSCFPKWLQSVTFQALLFVTLKIGVNFLLVPGPFEIW